MKVERPILITYIVDLNFLNVFLLIASFFPKSLEQFGFYYTPITSLTEVISKILMIISLLIISYGLLKLKKWGYMLMVAYNLFFLVLSMVFMLKQFGESFNMPGFITSILGLMITFPSKRYFIKNN
ncbi:hypothetical protein SH2C18_35410 [Clostridium sediminicola]|uniref:hypothetical protein n=1 Tax=Clostridium sediminicola TaxID=3114879 RepID=UPI0031F1FA9F